MLDAQIVMMHWKITDTNEDQHFRLLVLSTSLVLMKCSDLITRIDENLTAVGHGSSLLE